MNKLAIAKAITIIIISFSMLLLFPPIASSIDINNCIIKGAINGVCNTVTGDGTTILMGAGLNLNCFTFIDDSLYKHSQLTIPSQIQDLVIKDSVAFIAAGKAGLYTIDISNLNSPSILSVFDTPGFVSKILMTDKCLMIVVDHRTESGPSTIISLNVTDYNNPKEISNFTVSEFFIGIKEIAMRNDTAFVGSGMGLYIIDYKEIDNPVIISSYGRSTISGSRNMDLSFPVLDGNILYAGENNGGFHILDISNISDMKYIDFFRIGGDIEGVEINGDKLFVLGTYGGLNILSLEIPTKPQIINQIYSDNWVNDVFFNAKNRMFIATSNELKVTSTTNYQDPMEIDSYIVPGFAENVVVQDSYAYSIHWLNGLFIHDISDPSSPLLIGKLSTIHWPHSLTIVNNMAFFVNTNSKLHEAGLYIVDITVPTHPTIIGSYQVAAPTAVFIKDDRAFLQSSSINGFYILDVSVPSNPRLLLEYTMEYGHDIYPRDFFFEGNYLYIAGSFGLFIFEMSDYLNPQLVGTWMVDHLSMHDVCGVVVDGNFAYVTDQNCLNILEISDPANPILISNLSTPGYARHLEKHRDLVYVTDDYWGIRVIDVSDPEAPYEIANYDNHDYFEGLSVQGNRIYAANSSSGIPIIEMIEPHSTDSNSQSLHPIEFMLSVYPNPSNGNVIIQYTLNRSSDLKISIYNMIGKLVWETDFKTQAAGQHKHTWNIVDNHGIEVPSGLYFVKILSSVFEESTKIVILK